jgi:hypothetical protein
MATIVNQIRNAVIDAVTGEIDGEASAGSISFLTSGNVEIVNIPFADPSFDPAASGSAPARLVPLEASAIADGTMSKFRIYDGLGVMLIEGTVGTSGSEINFDSVIVVTGDTIRLNSLSISIPAS